MDRRLRSPAGRRRIGRQVLTSTPRRHSTECWVALYRVPVGTLQGAGWHPTRCWLALYRVDGGTLQDAGGTLQRARGHSTRYARPILCRCTMPLCRVPGGVPVARSLRLRRNLCIGHFLGSRVRHACRLEPRHRHRLRRHRPQPAVPQPSRLRRRRHMS